VSIARNSFYWQILTKLDRIDPANAIDAIRVAKTGDYGMLTIAGYIERDAETSFPESAPNLSFFVFVSVCPQSYILYP
jgi:hypothetical protein